MGLNGLQPWSGNYSISNGLRISGLERPLHPLRGGKPFSSTLAARPGLLPLPALALEFAFSIPLSDDWETAAFSNLTYYTDTRVVRMHAQLK